jgi:hypothetical protein
MKKIFFLILAVALYGCGDGGGGAQVIVTGSTDPVPEGEPETGDVVLALRTGTAMKFYDGSVVWSWKDETVTRAESQVYSAQNVLYSLDAGGETVTSKNLVTVPDGVCLDGANTWIIERVSPDEAYALGAQAKWYTKIFKNADEYGHWYDRMFYTEKITTLGTDVYYQKSGGTWWHIDGTKNNINVLVENGFVVWDFNATLRTAKIDDVAVSWTTNYFNNADHWLKSGSKWYSHNGYTWDGATLVENGSVMTGVRSYQNTVIPAGTRYENGEDVLYWIDCRTGYVIRHVPSVNQKIDFVRLYTGDGTNETGVYYHSLLLPVIADDNLYFFFDAQVYRYDFITGLVSLFTNGVSEVMEY